MDTRQLARFRKKLISERQRILEERSAQQSTATPQADSNADNRPDDLSDDAARYFDRGRNALATANIDQILAKIDRALQKIDEGTYGFSDVDGAPIPLARLNVLPYALTTVGQEERL